jgi:hypothetical protein
MKGKKIFENITKKRDLSNNSNNNYAQLLQTIFFELSAKGQTEDFYNLLELAETQSKKLTLKEETEPITTCSEIFLNDIILK